MKIDLNSLWCIVDEYGIPVPPMDENLGHVDQGMMVYGSRQSAEAAAEQQKDMYDIDAKAIPLAEVETD